MEIKNMEKFFDGWRWTIVSGDTTCDYSTYHTGKCIVNKKSHLLATSAEFSVAGCSEAEVKKLIINWFETNQQ